ncbi:MAG: lytic transglycosylase domain-containing protein [Elusimicrobia bacterium]|nr:lytic transglycosylase domain-containing protein [Elusimicrobiota bacterium]
MKAVLLGAVLAAAVPAGAVVSGNPADPAQSILQREQQRLAGNVLDWGDYLKKLSADLQSQYGPELARIKTDGGAAGSVEAFRPVQLRLEAWKQALLSQLFPALSGFAVPGESARLAQAQVEAFHAVGKLQQSVLSGDQRKFLETLRSRISQVSDAQSLDRLFDNAGLARPAPLPQVVFSGAYAGGSRSGLAAVQPGGLRISEVPSPLSIDAADRVRYARVIDYLRGQGASQKIIDMAISEAVRQKVAPLLVLALVQNESGFKTGATSPVGARGLMQIMPATGRGLGVRDADQLYDPSTNLRAGVTFLKSMWNKFTDFSWSTLSSMNPFASSDVKKVIASYNAGPGAVQKYGGVPPYRETRAYVQKVLSSYLHLRGLFGS